MHPTDPKPLGDYFKEGLDARLDARALHDNPYAAGSAKRREWHAGFCATVKPEDAVDPDPDEGPTPAT
ncbi:hypothetical protein D3273_09195 [Lichenibacterium minor]|uniref:Uncharacterized protein n=1 Tax=Lichenibacterium minor TaxID=2316528 RepID=A0A4Q2U760_9HYPH|nr:hypothetical protein [Lichenibacterium minor]RYC32202.1 hypothetical protein D3273_09195 [Lichenibacterium minor]